MCLWCNWRVTGFSCAHVNMRSLLEKVHELEECIQSYGIDVLAVTETWLTDSILDRVIQINGLVCVRVDRSGKGGGVAFYVRKSLLLLSHLISLT